MADSNPTPRVSIGPRALQADLWCILPVILGLVALVGGYGLMNWLDLENVTIDAANLQRAIELAPVTQAQLQARFAVGASFLFLAAAGAVAFAQSWRQIWLSFRTKETFKFLPRGPRARPVVFLAAVILGVVIYVVTELPGNGLISTLVPNAFCSTLGKCSVHGCGLGTKVIKICQKEGKNIIGDDKNKLKKGENGSQSTSYLVILIRKVSAANAISALAAAFIAIAACCLVIEAKNIPKTNDDAARAAFSNLAQRWKNHLYFAALFLVSGVIEMSAWRSWPAGYMKPKETATLAFEAAVNGTVLVEGLIFTITLFTIFFSTASLMNGAYTSCGLDKRADGSPAASPLADFKNLLDLKEVTKSALAILAPAISGAVPVLIDFVTKLSHL